MKSQSFNKLLVFVLYLNIKSFGLNPDGILLLSFKYCINHDPLGALQSWNYNDVTPCSWKGVSCEISGRVNYRVTGLSLPNCGLVGSVSATLGMIEQLRNLNLSNNSISGSLPSSLFAASELQFLDFANNLISGELPELVGKLKLLKSLNLSGNDLMGTIPKSLSTLKNLTVVSLKNNYFFGPIPDGFDSIHVLDLSSNLINGSLPPDFGGNNLTNLNIAYNRVSGEIPVGFAGKIPKNAAIDFSFNALTGPIPDANVFHTLATTSFAGNPKLCGKPLTNLCPTPSASSAAGQGKRTGLRTGTILGIVVGDVAGITILAFIFVYAYHLKKRKSIDKQRRAANGEEESTSESTSSDGGETENPATNREMHAHKEQRNGALVTIDGEKELELDTLLKASAYILGASGSSIMYKAVLEDGTTFAVRRIGENGVEPFRDFENQIRVIAKLVHPNLVRIRGFFWGTEEKLIIYDFVHNGSLANARYRKFGYSPCHFPWELRLMIAKGVARGLSYIHEKKHVHGNLKPTNILLGVDMEPKIGDFGLERLVAGYSSSKAHGSARTFGSKRSTTSRDSFQDFATSATPSLSPSVIRASPYHAPESLRSLKPNPKWDVFSFGVVLLELLTGKVIVSEETGPTLSIGCPTSSREDKVKVLRAVDVAIRGDLEGKEEAIFALLELGYGCMSHVPQKRPSMKEVLHTLDRFPS